MIDQEDIVGVGKVEDEIKKLLDARDVKAFVGICALIRVAIEASVQAGVSQKVILEGFCMLLESITSSRINITIEEVSYGD